VLLAAAWTCVQPHGRHGRSHSTSTSERPEDRPLPVKKQANGRGHGLTPEGVLEDPEFVQLQEPAAAKWVRP